MKIICIVFLCTFLFSSCDDQEGLSNGGKHKGEIIGYLKCSDDESENILFGVFIISTKKDSLLSFNIPPSFLELDTTEMDFGINFINGGIIEFDYNIVENDEIKQFYCPPSTMGTPTFYPIENFTQIITSNITKIK